MPPDTPAAADLAVAEALLASQIGTYGGPDYVPLRNRIAAALAAERERCAAVVEEQGRLLKAMFETDRYDALIRDLAAAIRKRGKL
jgi:hypothetical protein